MQNSATIHSHKFTFAMLSSDLINSLLLCSALINSNTKCLIIENFSFQFSTLINLYFSMLSYYNSHLQCSALQKLTFPIICCVLKRFTFKRQSYHKFTKNVTQSYGRHLWQRLFHRQHITEFQNDEQGRKKKDIEHSWWKWKEFSGK